MVTNPELGGGEGLHDLAEVQDQLGESPAHLPPLHDKGHGHGGEGTLILGHVSVLLLLQGKAAKPDSYS